MTKSLQTTTTVILCLWQEESVRDGRVILFDTCHSQQPEKIRVKWSGLARYWRSARTHSTLKGATLIGRSIIVGFVDNTSSVLITKGKAQMLTLCKSGEATSKDASRQNWVFVTKVEASFLEEGPNPKVDFDARWLVGRWLDMDGSGEEYTKQMSRPEPRSSILPKKMMKEDQKSHMGMQTLRVRWGWSYWKTTIHEENLSKWSFGNRRPCEYEVCESWFLVERCTANKDKGEWERRFVNQEEVSEVRRSGKGQYLEGTQLNPENWRKSLNTKRVVEDGAVSNFWRKWEFSSQGTAATRWNTRA